MYFRHERPYTEIFRALLSLEGIEELSEIYDQLADHLAALFSDVPEKDGVKQAGGLYYWYTGLVCHGGANSYPRVIIKPWKSAIEDIVEEPTEKEIEPPPLDKVRLPRKRTPAKYSIVGVVRDVFGYESIWAKLYSLYRGGRPVISEYPDLDEMAQTEKILRQVKQDDLYRIGLIGRLNHINYMKRSFVNRVVEDFLFHTSSGSVLMLPSEADFEFFNEVYALTLDDNTAYNKIFEYKEKLTPSDDRVWIPWDESRIYTPERTQWGERQYRVFSSILSYLRDEFLEKAQEHNTRYFFHQMGWVKDGPEKPKRGSQKRKEVQDGHSNELDRVCAELVIENGAAD